MTEIMKPKPWMLLKDMISPLEIKMSEEGYKYEHPKVSKNGKSWTGGDYFFLTSKEDSVKIIWGKNSMAHGFVNAQGEKILFDQPIDNSNKNWQKRL